MLIKALYIYYRK